MSQNQSSLQAEGLPDNQSDFATVLYCILSITLRRGAARVTIVDSIDVECSKVWLQPRPRRLDRKSQRMQHNQIVSLAEIDAGFYQSCFQVFLSALLRVKSSPVVIRSLAGAK